MGKYILLFAIFILSMPSKLFCQNNDELLEDEYTRPSITFFITRYTGDRLSQRATVSAQKINFSDKYFNHNLSTIDIELPDYFKEKSTTEKRMVLQEYLEKNNIGRKMIAKWFNRQENGMFSLDYFYECGLYSADDQDVLISKAAKRGKAILMDAGQKLVNKTYVLIISPEEFTSFDNEQSHGWKSTYDFFLFQLNFDEKEAAEFYEIWPYEDDPDDLLKDKISAFDTVSFPFKYVYGKSGQSSASTELYALTDNPKSSNQLFDEMVEDMYNDVLFYIDKNLESFRVKVYVSDTHPIRSKIGKKEGLRCDQRYFVYEYVWDDKTNSIQEKRKAVIRAKGKIADNRQIATGKSPESEFYQIYGGTIKEGMLMQQRNDYGISIIGGYTIGDIAGVEAGVMIRTGFFTKVPSLYIMADLGLDQKNYAPVDLQNKDYSFFRYSIGLGKGFRFLRIFELAPFASWGQESTSNDSLSLIRTNFVKAGGILGINITHNFSVFGKLNYYLPFGNVGTKAEDDDKELKEEDYEWTEKFAGREGMNIMFGLRFEF